MVDLKYKVTPKNTSYPFKYKTKLLSFFTKTFSNIYKYGFYLLIGILIGISAGVYSAKNFYQDKLGDCVEAGAFLYKEKIYQIIPK